MSCCPPFRGRLLAQSTPKLCVYANTPRKSSNFSPSHRLDAHRKRPERGRAGRVASCARPARRLPFPAEAGTFLVSTRVSTFVSTLEFRLNFKRAISCCYTEHGVRITCPSESPLRHQNEWGLDRKIKALFLLRARHARDAWARSHSCRCSPMATSTKFHRGEDSRSARPGVIGRAS